jgi:hypothetical protein
VYCEWCDLADEAELVSRRRMLCCDGAHRNIPIPPIAIATVVTLQ